MLPEEDLDHLDLLFADYGDTLYKEKTLPPRPADDIIQWDPERDQEEFDESIQWEGCPEEYRPKITELIKKYWDVFAKAGVRKPIRGYKFNIDTGNVKPVDCKPPRYGQHESRVIQQLADGLQRNGLIEPDDGPWGAMVVLAAKPHQEHKHWADYIWRLCVSYRKINSITRPFRFPTRRCDEAARDIGCLLYTSPSPRDGATSRMPSSA